jgi:threonine dehydratase
MNSMRQFTTPESRVDRLHVGLAERQRILDEEHQGLRSFGIATPELYVEELDGHTIVVLDESVQPGGAFKYMSSAASIATLPKEATEAVTVTAGNFGLTLGEAAARANIGARAFTPTDLNPVKRAGMLGVGMEVVLAGETVEAAMPVAGKYVDATDGAVLLHPFNNPWGIAGLRYMGEHVSDALKKLYANDSIDPARPTGVFIGLGGGSGVAGIASRLRSEKDAGDLPEHVTVHGVRPNAIEHGEMNPRFDGLRVAVPGSNTAPFLEDRRFTHGTRYVGEATVADATRFMAKLSDVQYEPNALIALGAVMQWITDYPEAPPRTFGVVLTGRNSDEQNYSHFKALDGYTTTEEYRRWREAAERRRNADLAAANHQATVRMATGISASADRSVVDRTRIMPCLGGATLRRHVAM